MRILFRLVAVLVLVVWLGFFRSLMAGPLFGGNPSGQLFTIDVTAPQPITSFDVDLANVGRFDAMAFQTAIIPEPSSIVLFGLGAIGLLAYSWRRKQKQAA